MTISYRFLCGILWLACIYTCSGATFAQDMFPDIADHIYQEHILALEELRVVKGYPNGNFGPDRDVTRAEMSKIVLASLLTAEELGEQSNCFRDVFNQRYAPYICYAKEHNIVKGYPDQTFKPSQPVTIAEGLKIALEAFGEPVDETNDDHWFEPYIDYVHKNNLFSAYTLVPDQNMTRAQMSYLTHQLLLKQQGEYIFTGERSNRSLGCEEKKLPATAPTSTTVRGQQRSFITTVGKKVKAGQATKLVIAFHGRTSPNREVRQYYGLEKVRDNDAIIIYPAGLPEQGPNRNRRAPGDTSDTMRGFELFDTLVEDISKQYCLDMDEVYVVGHSLGAWFTNSLACARGDVIRAIGSVGGSITHNECTGPVASLIMHNPNDRLAYFAGGVAARDQLLAQNNCGPEIRSVGPSQGNCVEYTNCIAGAPVIWCPHTQNTARRDGSYYPHTRPNFAGKMIWEFFDKHSD